MRRLFRISFLTVMLCVLGLNVGHAADKPEVLVGGRVAPGDVRVFSKDTVYKVLNKLVVGGTLIIEPGTTVKFPPNGRIIDSTGGRIIADGRANASYNTNLIPIGSNPDHWTGYADLNYFTDPRIITLGTEVEPTVNGSKADYVFNVILDKVTRKLRDGGNTLDGSKFILNPNEVVIPFEKAIYYLVSTIHEVVDPVTDIRNDFYWKRANSSDTMRLESGSINFIGQVTNSFTREKGHIVILPGARAAFFRDCKFENMRKDTTVDYTDYYNEIDKLSSTEVAMINKALVNQTNGAGGAITTYSSRTWLLDCEFNHNFARNAAGALQVLQAPKGYNEGGLPPTMGVYPPFKNFALTEPNGQNSRYNNSIPRIDNLDESVYTEMLTDNERQAYDDARLSVFLGRMRGLKFNSNNVRLSNVKIKYVGSIPVEYDDLDGVCVYPQHYGNYAKGGAVLIAGRPNDFTTASRIEVGLGVNDSIKIRNYNNTQDTVIHLTSNDKLEFVNNTAENYQEANETDGSMGGALYLGNNTSLIVAGKFTSNEAKTSNLAENTKGVEAGMYSRGGAIFQENTFGRLQVRGTKLSATPTYLVGNKSASGAGIYVDGNNDKSMSPIIGGADNTAATRDYGYDIKFQNNKATAEGGAIYTHRNMRINGAGGIINKEPAGLYTDVTRVLFNNNTAGYSGGAVSIALLHNDILTNQDRSVHFVRALFTENKVGDVSNDRRDQVRGGGAVYSEHSDMNVVKGVEFRANTVLNGNGAAIHMGNPQTFSKRFFVSDLDEIIYNEYDQAGTLVNTNVLNETSIAYPHYGLPTGVKSYDAPFTQNFDNDKYSADSRMLTRFLDNKISTDPDVLSAESGSGMTQINAGTIATNANIYAIEFVDTDNGFAVGDKGTVIKLTNGGAVWAYKNLGTDIKLSAIHFTTDQIGFIAGDQGKIWKTVDGGNTWTSVNTNGFFNINAMTFFNSTEGYAVGQSGQMMATTDGGNNWTVTTTGTANHLKDVRFIGSDNNGNAMGYTVGNRGTILVKRGTNPWTPQNANTFADFNSVYFTDASTGFIAGNGVIYKTTNNGQTWVNVFNKTGKSFNKIVFTSLDNGFAYGNFGTAYKTIDGGQTWDSISVDFNGNKLYSNVNDVFYPTQNTAVLSSNDGLMLRTIDNGATWTSILPFDQSRVDIKRLHPSLGVRENGIGLGGAIYIIDSVTTREGKDDYVRFNRVRFEGNESFTGAAIYSDNFDLKLVLTRSLAVANIATSQIGQDQNAISGPANDRTEDGVIDGNYASSDLAGAVFYGEIVGPEPYASYSWAANSLYGNYARFLIRLPDAPNTKGAFAGRRPGPGGVDTLQGNYWGKTEADVTLYIENVKDSNYVDENGNLIRDFAQNPTFFVEKCDKTYLSYVFGTEGDTSKVLSQGPFESNGTYNSTGSGNEYIKRFNYAPIALRNKTDNENVADSNTIPEKFLFSGRIYDLLDKGTDIKVADYSNRRLSPIEDFAVGIPPVVLSHADAKHPNGSTYVTRWVRNPFDVEALDTAGNLKYPAIAALQTEWQADVKNLTDGTNGFYQPIGYPLFLEAKVNYNGDPEVLNNDERFLNESVFFVINETTGDFIRTNMLQVEEQGIGNRYQTLRSRVELVPDMTMRNQQTSIRRTAEKLLNLGSGDLLMRALKYQPENEDKATLQGRKYYGPKTLMGGQDRTGINDLYINRDTWAPSNNDYATYFAGEKYQALPVLVGDVVRVVSRTQLWKETVEKAFLEGISFKIVNSTMPPAFTGDVIKLQTNNIPEYANTVLVTEDRTYPCPDSEDLYSTLGKAAGRDSILAITGYDYNNFYDPRAVSDSLKDFYANLRYSLNLPANTGVSKWIRYELRTAAQGEKDSASGYMVLRGTPMNPYVVPGGENVNVKIENFAPSKQTIDWVNNEFDQDTKDKFIYIFPSYFNAPNYDLAETARRARYLQQDTIFNTRNYSANYNFKIMVLDSTPRFIAYNDNNYPEVQYMDVNYNPLDATPKYQDSNKVRVMYLPTNYSNGFCAMTADGKIIASVTDKLRLQADLNTDDEAEDNWAGRDGWDFRYGKTSYGFWNVASTNNPDQSTSIDERNQTRPTWMGNAYIYKYNSDNITPASPDKDPYLSNYTAQGKLNVRLDGTVARQLLGVTAGTNKAMNLDTVFTVVANDGHSGMTVMPVEVYVNVAPSITSATNLPDALEGTDYNPTLTDTNKIIKIYDPNENQTHRFELIYKNDPRAQIAKDPCFSEAGNWDLGALKTTPSWLKINPVSGLLYGTPTVKDLTETSTANITVAVWDQIKQASVKANINAIKAVGNQLFAVGNQGIIVKIDAASTKWDFVKVPVAQTFKLNDVTFAKGNDQVGYIAGNNGLILKTTNGGTAWDTIPNTNVAQFKHYNFNTIDFIDVNNGVVAGDDGHIFTTNNGGLTWKDVKKNNPNTSKINKVKMYSASEFIAGCNNGAVIKTVNNGDAFTTATLVGADGTPIHDIYEVNTSKTLLISDNKVLSSTDKGSNWSPVSNVPVTGSDIFTSIGFYENGNDAAFNSTKDNIVYITGNNSTLYFSKDGGNNFVKSNVKNFKFNTESENMTKNVNDLVMVNDSNGYVVGEDGIIAHINRSYDTYTIKTNLGDQVVTDTVITPTIITTKEYDMLSDVKTFTMNVQAISHNPNITTAVNAGCIQIGDTASTLIYVMDNDLLRPNSTEKLTLTIIYPENSTSWVIKDTATMADKYFVTNADLGLLNKNNMIPLLLTSKGPLTEAAAINDNGRVIVRVQVKDEKGNLDTIEVSFRFSKQPDFISYITVANSNNSSQVLEWGTAPNVPNVLPLEVTTGDGNSIPGSDKVAGDFIGALDVNYCEYEIPPVPDSKVFDARWTIPTRTGTLRNIFPRAIESTMCEFIYKAAFQTGGNVDANGTSNYVPVAISWDTTLIPDKDSPVNPAGSTWYLRDASSNGNIFNINMRDGKGSYTGATLSYVGTTAILTLSTVTTQGFNIAFDCTSAVNDGSDIAAGIQTVVPNPVSSSSVVTFGVKQYGTVKIEVYDAIGNLVNTITNAEFSTGIHNIEFTGKDFSGNNLANGTYTVRMISGTDVSTYQVKVVR